MKRVCRLGAAGMIRVAAIFGFVLSQGAFAASPNEDQCQTATNLENPNVKCLSQVNDKVSDLALEPCNPAKVANATVGYTCQALGHKWRVERVGMRGPIYYHDMESGLKVRAPLKHAFRLGNNIDTVNPCASYRDFRLPSGDPLTHSERPSDFKVLAEHGIMEVVPGLSEKGKWFWSATLHPKLLGSRYILIDGKLGGYVTRQARVDRVDHYVLVREDGTQEKFSMPSIKEGPGTVFCVSGP